MTLELPELDVPETIDHHTAPGLVLRAYASLDAQPRGVLFDLGHTEAVDDVGLQALRAIAGYADAGGGVLLLRNVSDAVAALLREDGLDQHCFVRRQNEHVRAARAERARRDAERAGDPHATSSDARPSGGHLRLVRPEE